MKKSRTILHSMNKLEDSREKLVSSKKREIDDLVENMQEMQIAPSRKIVKVAHNKVSNQQEKQTSK